MVMGTIQKQNRTRLAAVGCGWPILGPARVSGFIWLTILLTGLGTGFGATLPGTYSVNLAWNRSPSLDVVGYRIYYGGAAGKYSNSVVLGNVTSNSVPGLAGGVTYFFAVVAYNASGIESPPSNEIMFVPGRATLRISIPANRRAVLTVIGPAGRTYEIQAAPTPTTTWAVIGTVTIGTNGSVSFTDTNAPGFPKRFYRTRDTQP